jgi:hypothetical protein
MEEARGNSKHGVKESWLDGWMAGWLDGWMDGWTEAKDLIESVQNMAQSQTYKCAVTNFPNP